jgi:hypothetical protein
MERINIFKHTTEEFVDECLIPYLNGTDLNEHTLRQRYQLFSGPQATLCSIICDCNNMGRSGDRIAFVVQTIPTCPGDIRRGVYTVRESCLAKAIMEARNEYVVCDRCDYEYYSILDEILSLSVDEFCMARIHLPCVNAVCKARSIAYKKLALRCTGIRA